MEKFLLPTISSQHFVIFCKEHPSSFPLSKWLHFLRNTFHMLLLHIKGNALKNLNRHCAIKPRRDVREKRVYHRMTSGRRRSIPVRSIRLLELIYPSGSLHSYWNTDRLSSSYRMFSANCSSGTRWLILYARRLLKPALLLFKCMQVVIKSGIDCVWNY